MSTPSTLQPKAVVLPSGGLDSATTQAMAKAGGYACHALSFSYGQRQLRELESAQQVAAHQGVVEHRIVNIDLRAYGGSALTNVFSAKIPTSYVCSS